MVIIGTLENKEIIKLFCDIEITYEKIGISEDLDNNLYFNNNNNIIITLIGNFEFIYDLQIGEKYIITLNSYFLNYKNLKPLEQSVEQSIEQPVEQSVEQSVKQPVEQSISKLESFIPKIECYMINFTIGNSLGNSALSKIEFLHRKNLDSISIKI